MNLSVLLAILFFVSGCHKAAHPPTYELSLEDRVWMERFFTGLMLQNSAIYTLCGSKPTTCITIHYLTDEEIQAHYDQMTEEDKKSAVYVEDYELTRNWEKWEQIQSHFPMSRYKIYKKNDTNDAKFAHVYFVNPLKVAQAMLENYTIFKDAAGFDFDPSYESSQIEKGSPFWDKIQHNPITNGLLFGFGLKNSLKFYEEHWGGAKDTQKDTKCVIPYVSDHLSDGKSSLENLIIPAFISFFEDDEIIEQYKKERETIRSEYQGKDFLDYTLQKLTSQ